MNAVRSIGPQLLLLVSWTLLGGCASAVGNAPADPGPTGGLAASSSAEASEPDCGAVADADLVGRVEQFVLPDDGRVGVVFYGDAAVFRLPVDHPCLGAWMALLQRSRDFGTYVRMSLDPGAGEITAVASAVEADRGWRVTPTKDPGAETGGRPAGPR